MRYKTREDICNDIEKSGIKPVAIKLLSMCDNNQQIFKELLASLHFDKSVTEMLLAAL